MNARFDTRALRFGVGALAAVSLILAFGAGGAAARQSAASRADAQVTVYAAASLTDVFPKIDPTAKYSFAGSNTLAAQITQGAPADVFASANMTIPNQLNAKNLVSKPVVFTRNTLVVVVPTSNPANIKTVYDLRKPGTKLVVAGPAVPVGAYTIQILRNMGLSSVLQNVVSRETDVREVLAKVALGEADAGFVYSTDARTVPGKVKVIEAARVGAAEGAVRDLGRLCEPEQGSRAGVREQGPEQGRAEEDDRGRLPAAGQAEGQVALGEHGRLRAQRRCSASPSSSRAFSRAPSWRCRSSRSSCTFRRATCSRSSRTRSSPTR